MYLFDFFRSSKWLIVCSHFKWITLCIYGIWIFACVEESFAISNIFQHSQSIHVWTDQFSFRCLHSVCSNENTNNFPRYFICYWFEFDFESGNNLFECWPWNISFLLCSNNIFSCSKSHTLFLFQLRYFKCAVIDLQSRIYICISFLNEYSLYSLHMWIWLT